jgi:hypothetical protein
LLFRTFGSKGNYLLQLNVHFLMFLESFLLFAQHVSDLTEPIIRSTTVVYAAICFRFVVFYSLRLVLVFCHITVSRPVLDCKNIYTQLHEMLILHAAAHHQQTTGPPTVRKHFFPSTFSLLCRLSRLDGFKTIQKFSLVFVLKKFMVLFREEICDFRICRGCFFPTES